MSSYTSRSPRDRSQEIEEPGVGVRGIPVDARCTGCKQVTVRRALPSDREDRRVEVSFKAPCHRCQKVTWWNSLQVLDGLLDEEHKAALGELDDDVDDPEEDDLDRGDGIETDGGELFTPDKTGNKRSIFPYPGGKSTLAPWIVEQFPDHHCYVEVFGGSASVLLSKEPSKVEVYNDRDGDLTHFFETFRDRTEELIEHLRLTPYSRDVHEKYANQYYQGYRPEDDIERAARFFYLRYSQFASKYKSKSGFSSGPSRSRPSALNKARENLRVFADRFDDVVIENLDYTEIFDRFDGEETLLYLDPPYLEEGDGLYTHGKFDHEKLVEELIDLQSDWIVSYTDVPDPLSEYHIIERDVEYSKQNAKSGEYKSATERLVTNYDPEDVPRFSGSNRSLTEVYK